jgi:hypothetical protein
MPDEEIVAMRKIRHEISAECEHDVHKVAEYCRGVADQLRREGKIHPKDATRRDAPKRHELREE